MKENDYLPDDPKAYDLSNKTVDELEKVKEYCYSLRWFKDYDEGNRVDKAELSAYREAVMLEVERRK